MRSAVLVVAPVVIVTETVIIRINTVVNACLPVGASPLLCIKSLHSVVVERGSDAGIEVNLDFSFLTFLCSDDDDTVSSAATIDRSRCSVLQHLNRLDIVTVKVVQTCLCRHTIDDVERVVVVQRSDTTDTNSSLTRKITFICDVHTRNTSLEGFHRVVFVLLSKFVNANNRYRTSKVGLALCGITCYHNFVKQLGVALQDYLHTLCGGQFLSGITHISEYECCTRFYF